MERISIFLVDPNQLFREGLKLLLEDCGCDVAGEARSLQEVMPLLVPGRRVDLVLMGSACGAHPAEPALGAIRAQRPHVKAVILADLDADDPPGLALRSADARLGNDLSVAMLVRGFRHVMAGESVDGSPSPGAPALAAKAPRDLWSGVRRRLRRLAAGLSIRPLLSSR
jgi:two-component system nitrate/nitrite response regulator NarL